MRYNAVHVCTLAEGISRAFVLSCTVLQHLPRDMGGISNLSSRFQSTSTSACLFVYGRLRWRSRSCPRELHKIIYSPQLLTLCSNTATYYICTSCQAPYEQPLGKAKTNVHEKSGAVNYVFRTHAGPPVGDKCLECESTLHVSAFVSGPVVLS